MCDPVHKDLFSRWTGIKEQERISSKGEDALKENLKCPEKEVLLRMGTEYLGSGTYERNTEKQKENIQTKKKNPKLDKVALI